MKVALSIVCSEKLDAKWQPSTLPFNMEDSAIAESPVLFFEGNVNDIRRKIHYIVDTICDRSYLDLFFKHE